MPGEERVARFEAVADFMLEEFRVLNKRVAALEAANVARANFYITILGGVAGAAAVLYESNRAPSVIELWLALPAALLLLGLYCLAQQIERASAAVFLYRRAGRIRSWFHDIDPSIIRFLPWQPGDDTPPFSDDPGYSTFAAHDAILYLGNSINGALLITGAFGIRLPWALKYPLFITVFFLGVAFVWLLQLLYVKWSARRYERIGQRAGAIHCPAEIRRPQDLSAEVPLRRRK